MGEHRKRQTEQEDFTVVREEMVTALVTGYDMQLETDGWGIPPVDRPPETFLAPNGMKRGLYVHNPYSGKRRFIPVEEPEFLNLGELGSREALYYVFEGAGGRYGIKVSEKFRVVR